MHERFRLIEPLGLHPRLAVAVSGGADSMALALLARDWTRARGGTVLGLIVDHGLRANSAAEAALVHERLLRLGIAARVLTLQGVDRSAEAARQARYAALEAACVQAGCVHLLLGHHAADQSETLQIRALAGSGADGFAGMTELRETRRLRLLRPLLRYEPADLKQFLTSQDVEWVEDPSNADTKAQRGRLRLLAAGRGISILSHAARMSGHLRAQKERAIADWLGKNALLSPLGYAVIPPGSLPAPALSALIQSVAGLPYPPPISQVAPLAMRPRAATLAGAALVRAGRLGGGWLLVREVAAIGPPVPAAPGELWDRRFRVEVIGDTEGQKMVISEVGADASWLRRHTSLPSIILRGLPAIRLAAKSNGWHQTLVAVPHIGYASISAAEALRLQYSPARPAACASWWETSDEMGDAQ